ncbi:hypothetical protein [Mammaliicoccus lentus]|uniref:hypothetical protein n=1 Tax=Mammaliicoccus lentus TaxID=42858 RepID=UPI0010718482|nr:hypothetical protein [Mammaliicoccus lentus]MBF0748795.1 hypothetical protein [Mammaliicoccus lentus]TFU58400.1 hypothetical protein E4T93_05205 [Mammaliicoccus lentus]
MNKLFILCLSSLFLLTACGSKVDGTYSNNDMSITADSESGNASLHLNAMESEGFLGIGESDGTIDGNINPDEKVMIFSLEGEQMKLNYKVKGDKLVIENPTQYGNEDDTLELTKEE